jgi:hypothetical protein
MWWYYAICGKCQVNRHVMIVIRDDLLRELSGAEKVSTVWCICSNLVELCGIYTGIPIAR